MTAVLGGIVSALVKEKEPRKLTNESGRFPEGVLGLNPG